MAFKAIARKNTTVTPDDSTAVNFDALYVGTGGTVKVKDLDGTDGTYVNVSNGQILPVSVSRVYSTGTTASNIVGLNFYQ
jgi:hypothetical protein